MQKNFTHFSKLKDTTINNQDKNQSYLYLSQDLIAGRGEKRFYEIPFNDVYTFYNYMDTNHNLYEIIPENTEVRPYFDLEIEEEKAHYKPKRRVLTFVKFVIKHFQDIFNVTLTQDDFIFMNSTRENKLSYHLVINNYKFSSNADQKIFIKYLKQEMDKMNKSDPDFLAMRWLYKETEERYIFDCIPYNKNQNIRLINQSKKGKAYTLKLESDVEPYETFCRVFPDSDYELLDTSNIELEAVYKKRTPVKKPPTVSKKQEEKTTEYEEKTTEYEETNKTNTLYTYHKMTLTKLKKEPQYYQYLALIPNDNINWEIYRNIGFALKGCDCSLSTFKSWASLSPKYDDNDQIFQDYEKFRGKNEPIRYDARYLRFLAKTLNSELYNEMFDEKQDKILDYLTCNYRDFIRINEKSKYIASKEDGSFRFYNDLEKADISVLHAFMGKGKTTYIKKKLQYLRAVHNMESVLFISPRQSFANFISGAFRGVKNYMEIKGNVIMNVEKLVCSIESLHKIDVDTKFDVVILDECESIFKSFSSPTVKNSSLTIQILKERIDEAKKIVFADAFITNRSLDFIRSVGKNRTKTILTNFKHNENRKAVQIENMEFNQRIVNYYETNNPIYACFTSRKKMFDLKTDLCLDFDGHLDNNSMWYHADNSKKENDTLKNVNETWSDKRLICTTGKITVGVSYDEGRPFDYCFLNASCNIGPTPRDIMQMIMRVRHLDKNKVYYTLPTRMFYPFGYRNFHMTFEEYVKKGEDKVDFLLTMLLNNRMDQNSTLYKNVEGLKHSEDMDLKRIMYANIRETIVSQSCFSQLLLHLLKISGYTVRTIHEDKRADPKREDINQLEEFREIDDIPLWEATQLKEKLKFDKNEFLQKRVDKAFFNQYWKEQTSEEKKAKLFHQYRNIYQKKKFDNVKLEKQINHNPNLAKALEQEMMKFNYNLSDMPMSVAKLNIIRQINESLQLDHSQDDKEISATNMNETYKWMKDQVITQINTVFNKNVVLQNNDYDKKKCFNALNDIYKNWSGMSLKVLQKDRNKIATSYGLTGISFYDNVKTKQDKKDVFETDQE